MKCMKAVCVMSEYLMNFNGIVAMNFRINELMNYELMLMNYN